MGDAEAQSARDTQSEAKKTEPEKDVGKVGSFVRSACFVQKLGVSEMEHAKTCETQENWMKQKGKLCFAETIHDIHGNVEVKNP